MRHSTTAARPSRVDFAAYAPQAFTALIRLDVAARKGLDPALVELVQIRASQVNDCAYCLHMHTSDARKGGESEDRFHMVHVWKDATHYFTTREHAALALTEAATRITDGVSDGVHLRAAENSEEVELAGLIRPS